MNEDQNTTEKPPVDEQSVVILLARIAAALERIADSGVRTKPPQLDLVALLPKRYHDRATEIIDIVIASKSRRGIVLDLKAAGIVSRTTYWKDVTFFYPLLEKLAG